MYVCICHAVTEDDVHGCITAGAGSVKEVRAACGMPPGCGSCTKRLCALVNESRAADPLADELSATLAELDAEVGTAA